MMEPRRSRLSAETLTSFFYLLHLAVPALLLLDIFAGMARGRISPFARGQDSVAALSFFWLAAGLRWYFAGGDRAAFLRRITAPLVTVYTVYFVVLLIEAGVRLVGLAPPIPGARQPWTHAITRMDPRVTPGISGLKRFTTNALGLRGPMPPRDPRVYRILAIGGSTTICANLDDAEEWTYLLMRKTNERRVASPVWVGNAGIAASNTVNHLVLMQWLPGALHVDMAIFLIGVNDMTATLALEGAPSEHDLELGALYKGKLPAGTHFRTQKIYPYYQRLRLLLLARDVTAKLAQRFGKRPALPLMEITPFRQRRLKSPVLPLPDLSTGLAEYRWRIREIAERCADNRIRCLFLTQPTMWKADASPAENALFWQGYVGHWENPKGYLTSADMARAMDSYNHTLLETCRGDSLECYDLAADIPKSTDAFFDEMHFNENGARLVAERLADYIAAHPPPGKAGVQF
jgi:hypothetical protein